MDGRKKTFLSCCLFFAAFITAGCGSITSTQQSKFQTSFLPPAPQALTLEDADLPKVPLGQPNIYLEDLPAILVASPSLPPRRTSGDVLAERAERRFEAGKKLYQAQDFVSARREFDTAVDLMLQASAETPADRPDYEKKFDEM